MFIMIDGLDGCGKGTIMDAIKEYITTGGNPIFDMRKYWLDTKEYPELSEFKAYDFALSCEPTYAPMGRIIREELINKDNNYRATSIAHAFSLDRLILYKKIIIPLLSQNKTMIQDRGVSTSLAYQLVHSSTLKIEDIAEMPGNKLALENAPDYLIILDLPPEVAMQRIGGRADKQDNAVFEKLDFLQNLRDVFHSEKYVNLFKDRGTKIIYLSTDKKIDIMKQEAITLFKKITNE